MSPGLVTFLSLVITETQAAGVQKQAETSRDEGSAPRERTSGVYSWSKSHPRSRAPFLLGTFGRAPCGQRARWKWVAEQMSSHREARLRGCTQSAWELHWLAAAPGLFAPLRGRVDLESRCGGGV